MRVYITGATGYLGANLVASLTNNNKIDEIRMLVSDKERKNSLLGLIQTEKSIDSKNYEKTKLTFQIGRMPSVQFNLDSIDLVVHAGALIGIEEYKRNLKNIIDSNILGTKALVDSIIKYKCSKTLFVSSQSVYLNNPKLPWKETDEPAPVELYAASKYAGEELIKALEDEGLNYAIIRPSRIYGVGHNMRKNELLVKFARNMLNGLAIEIHGSGKNSMDFIHINDLVRLICLFMENDNPIFWNQIFNAGSGKSVSLIEIAGYYEKIGKDIGKTLEIKNLTGEQYNKVINSCIDISKAKALLGWEPLITLYDGIKEIVINEAKS